MQRLSLAVDFRPAELTQAAVHLFEDTLLCSAREVLGLKKCVQGRRHAWWTPELRLLIDRRRAMYIDARRAQERGLGTWPALHGQWRALRTAVKEVVRSAKQKLWRDQMHSCNDLFKANEARSFWQLLRWRSSGVCPPATANHVAMIRTPAGHTVCSDVGITSAFAHHYARLGEPSPQTLLILMRSTCDMFRHRSRIMLRGHLTLVTLTLHLMPFRREMKLQAVWRSYGITRPAQRRALSTRC